MVGWEEWGGDGVVRHLRVVGLWWGDFGEVFEDWCGFCFVLFYVLCVGNDDGIELRKEWVYDGALYLFFILNY